MRPSTTGTSTSPGFEGFLRRRDFGRDRLRLPEGTPHSQLGHLPRQGGQTHAEQRRDQGPSGHPAPPR
eukprot:9186358-Pyramimonas_sp.AAC.1